MNEAFSLGAEVTLVVPATRFREREETPVRINKVGRKYFYVEPIEDTRYFNGGRFSLADGFEASDYSYMRRRCTTPEILAAENERAGASAALADAGIRFNYGTERKLTTSQLQAILKVIQGADDEA